MELTLMTVPAARTRPGGAGGMHGSPTLLVNGADPVATPGQPPSLSCRPRRHNYPP